jgi:hypothetical protein
VIRKPSLTFKRIYWENAWMAEGKSGRHMPRLSAYGISQEPVVEAKAMPMYDSQVDVRQLLAPTS